MLLAYRDYNALVAPCFAKRDYSPLRQIILDEKDTLDEYLTTPDGEVWGYRISRNNPVSRIYGMEVKVVRFEFSHVNTQHDDVQTELMLRLCEMLKKRLLSENVYWNIRVPIHIVDLIRAFQKVAPPMYFCGGTMEYVCVGKTPEPVSRPDLRVFMADAAYCAAHRQRLSDIAYRSFNGYLGQYHVSPVTSDKAALVYRDWIDHAFVDYKPDSLLVAELNGEICSFLLLEQCDTVIDALLGATDSNMRASGAFQALKIRAIELCRQTGRLFVSSTQFDNFISAGTMNSVGMRPFYGIYNYHFDNRGGQA